MSVPDTIRFTGLEIAPEEILKPRKRLSGPYPASWARYQFTVPYDFDGTRTNAAKIERLDRWIEANTLHAWGSYERHTMEGNLFVVLFEDEADAVMFRMKGGDQEFLLDEREWGPSIDR